jgi:hypothetical protein
MTTEPKLYGDDDLVRRAMAAYFRHGGDIVDQPSRSDSSPVEFDGKDYVVLVNTYHILAVYRLRNDGMLKGLRRWPAALNRAFGLDVDEDEGAA